MQKINAYWDDERLYQEARRIVGAELQVITWKEWLPVLVGKQNMEDYGLTPYQDGYYSDYHFGINPTIINSYASAVGMFFFSMMPDQAQLAAKV